MRILVLGAGVVGLCSAYRLAREGHQVTVVDAEAGPGLGTSFANGGQLSYSYVAPLAGPGVLGKVPFWLLDPEGPLHFRPRPDPHQWKWLLRFVRACNATTAEQTTRRLLLLAYLSRDLMRDVVATEHLDFDHAKSGKLVVQPSAEAMEGAKRQMELQARWGSEQQALTREECLAIEPSLVHIAHRIAGGVYTPSEEAGDAFLFCQALTALLQRSNDGVQFVWGAEARQLLRVGGRVVACVTTRGVIEADAFVLALGNGARALAKPLGVDLPVYPLKGYSLTLPIVKDAAAPRISVTDSARKVVYARLGDALRVAGMADVVGPDKSFDERRLDLLVRQAREAFPDAARWDVLTPWVGLRPATPTGLPILGPTRQAPNLYLNVGQGALGFTLAMGCAAVITELLANRPSPIPLDGMVPGLR
ncbi:MAG: D-amino acid dehydrogenase [Acetobacteraceae bacterium]|nr:D-amino acid dehydrogenase [Acetobacteraceae bacterium]